MTTAQGARRKAEDGLWETIKVIIQALLIAFFVRTFFYQPFNIPSASMYPSLRIGDYLFVSKLSYGYGKHSFDFSLGLFGKELVSCCPIDFAGRAVLADTPKRGDIAVFKKPSEPKIDYIKRVIGLPGDRIQMRGGVLFINDQEVKKVRVEDFKDASGDWGGDALQGAPQFEETLPEGITYRVLDIDADGFEDNTPEFLVPEGHYFMMGDNRDNSADSRTPEVRYVPIENFVGRADIIFFSIEPEASMLEIWKWPTAMRWSRFFNLL